ncbi:hypothetical protein [Pedobacter punctiformis]|uniref:Lipocalin-like domain-containing protein n=1 Tax=Pedobacter punctiformis TaxID=3004097 RepID=A0ABT4L7E8_9SPHI|nr:hypothetical protein [Pedobacter sp. HCMS5-2]MCZ4243848.1 hypothetical protein [Pedobacter sp. HCMS5-2]
MKLKLLTLSVFAFFISCKSKTEKADDAKLPIQGTWQLISGTTIENGTSKTTDYSKDSRMIKIINDTHFAFLRHSTNPKDTNGFDAGGGRYTLADQEYTEHLDYYKDKNWEGKTFKFNLTLSQDTLIQKGEEKVEEAGINRVIIEKYVKVRP